MSENKNKNNGQNPNNNEDVGPFRNLAQNLIKKENSADLGSILELATSLLNNNALMNSLVELDKKSETPASPEKQKKEEKTSSSEKLEKPELQQNSSEMVSLDQQLKELTRAVSELKIELQSFKEQNESLVKYVKKLNGNKK